MKLDRLTIIKIGGLLAFAVLLYCGLQNLAAVKEGAATAFSYISPFVVGGALAFVINVPMRSIEKHLFPNSEKLKKIRRPLALVLTLLAVAAVIALVCLAVIPQLGETIGTLAVRIPEYMTKVQEYINEFLAKYPSLQEQFLSMSIDWQGIDWEGIVGSVSGWLSTGVVSTIDVVGSAINSIVSGVIGFIFALYILVDKERFGRQAKMIVYAIFPEKAADKLTAVAAMTSKIFASFISGQCLEACILGCLFAVAMAIFRMPYITLVSVLIAFTALIPVVGAFIGCGVGAFLIFMQNPMQALGFIVMFLVIQQLEGNLIYPKVVGNSVGLPAIWVLAGVTVGGKLMGALGMLIMIPLTSVCYALFREFIVNKLYTKNERVQKLFFSKVKKYASAGEVSVPVTEAAESVTAAEEKPAPVQKPAQNTGNRNRSKKKRR